MALRDEREAILAALEVVDAEEERAALVRRLDTVRHSLEQASPVARSPVPVLRRARACAVPWEGMEGSHRLRRCGSCGAEVHDVTALCTDEIVDLIASAGPGLRVRRDGRLQRGGCPRSWRPTGMAAAALVAMVVVVLALRSLDGEPPMPRAAEPALVLRETWHAISGPRSLSVGIEVRSSDRTLARGEVEPLLRYPGELMGCLEGTSGARLELELAAMRGRVTPRRASSAGTSDRTSLSCATRALTRHVVRNAPPHRSCVVRFVLGTWDARRG